MRKYKPYIILISIILILIVSISVLSAIWPKSEEQFFELGLLDSSKKTEKYFSSNSSTINLDTPTLWYIYLSNHMGTDQKVILMIKLLNSTDILPDDKLHTPSPLKTSYEIPISLSVNQTTDIPFLWSVSKVQNQGGKEYIKGLIINGDTVDVNVTSTDSHFRVLFELWVQNKSGDEYFYGWNTGKESLSASVYIWFVINSIPT